jgi:hypothetical protein
MSVEQFIAQLRVEALAVAILPWAAWLDVGSLGSDIADLGSGLTTGARR